MRQLPWKPVQILLPCFKRLMQMVPIILLPLLLTDPARSTNPGSTAESLERLEQDRPVERKIFADQSHEFEIDLENEDYLELKVDQKGIDLVVEILGPAGELLASVDTPIGTIGSEVVHLMPLSRGTYRVKLYPFDDIALPGFYKLAISQLRRANDVDKIRVSAQTRLNQVRELIDSNSDDDLGKAIKQLEEVLGLWRASGSKRGEAITLHYTARLHKNKGNLERSLELSTEAIERWRDLGDGAGEASSLELTASICKSLGKKQEAFQHFDSSLAIRRNLGDRSGEASVLNQIGVAHHSFGETRKALEFFEKVLLIRREIGDLKGEALALTNLGGIYNILGDTKEAVVYLERALSIRRRLADRLGEAGTLTQFGRVFDRKGDRKRALDYHSEALRIYKAERDLSGEASSLNNIANAYKFLGEMEAAQDYLERALGIWQKLRNRRLEAVALNNLGNLYNSMGQKRRALDYYNQSLPIRREMGDLSGEAATLHNLGNVYNSLGEYQKALDYLSQALPLRRLVGDRSEEATTINTLGAIHRRLGKPQEALKQFVQALSLARKAGNRNLEAIVLNNIGGLYSQLGEKQKALNHYRKALSYFEEAGSPRGQSILLNAIGAVYKDLGEPQKALEYYQRSLEFRRALADRFAEATILNNIGTVYSNMGQIQKALEYLEHSLSLRRALSDRKGEATTLNNIAGIYKRRGDHHLALDHYEQALRVWRELPDPTREAVVLNNLAGIYTVWGEYQTALEYYEQALSIRRQVGDRLGEAVTLNNIGSLYKDLGRLEKALQYYNQAIPIQRAIRHRPGEAASLHNIGSILKELGQVETALIYYEQALPVCRAVGDRLCEATTLNNIGAVFQGLGKHEKALGYYELALPIRRAVADRLGEASTLNNIGNSIRSSGDFKKALEYYEQALSLWHQLSSPLGESSTHKNIAKLERMRGNRQESRRHIERSIELVESLRANVLSHSLRSSFLASKQGYYGFYIDLLMELHESSPDSGYDVEALIASERARTRSLVELLAEAHVSIEREIEPQMLKQRISLQRRIDATERRRLELLRQENATQERIAAEKRLHDLIESYRSLEDTIRKGSSAYSDLTHPDSIDLSEIQEVLLDKNTLLLEYRLGEKRSFLWAVTPDAFWSYYLPGRAEIERTSRRAYDLLTAPNRSVKGENLFEKRRRLAKAKAELPGSLAALSQLVLGPLANRLENKRLVIVPDGALQYVPFGALPMPSASWSGEPRTATPLIVDHEVVNLPSLSALRVEKEYLAKRVPASKEIAVFADPVFSANDRRVRNPNVKTQEEGEPPEDDSPPLSSLLRAKSDFGLVDFPRLRFTRREARDIARYSTKDNTFEALDFDASRSSAVSDGIEDYRFIHFATHGLVNDHHPELSGLVLSLVDENGRPQNGFLRLHDIFNLRLGADLVVLSACRTALGKDISGEGLVGLTRGFMYAGSASIVASLWSVQDRATARLMKRFYRGLLVDKLKPAAALRSAQVAMWRERGWSSPYYWAGFVLQGEWR